MSMNDLFERITIQIIAAIERGTADYQMPWHRWGANLSQPINAISGSPYRGINRLLLWSAAEASGYPGGRWATYRQWRKLDAQVRIGEKSSSIVFWKISQNLNDDVETENSLNRRRPFARVYAVFNEQQVDGAPVCPKGTALSQEQRIETAESLVMATGANIRQGGDHAYYDPTLDLICVPKFEQFRDPESYYLVLAHECIHWTGAEQRLNRDLSGRFGSDSYAMEELVAELGSAFIGGSLGIGVEPRPDHAAYISSWLRILARDSRAILTAAANAELAANYLIDFSLSRAA